MRLNTNYWEWRGEGVYSLRLRELFCFLLHASQFDYLSPLVSDNQYCNAKEKYEKRSSHSSTNYSRAD